LILNPPRTLVPLSKCGCLVTTHLSSSHRQRPSTHYTFTHLTSLPLTFSNLQQTHLTHNNLSNHTPTLIPFTSTTNMVTTLEFSALYSPFTSSPYPSTPPPQQQKQPKQRKQKSTTPRFPRSSDSNTNSSIASSTN